MLGFQHVAGLADVDRLLVAGLPGQLGQPLQVGADHAGFRAAFGHALEAAELAAGLLLDLLGEAGLVEGALEVLELGGGVVVLAELLLDLLELLAEQELALAALHGLAGAGADVGGEAQDLEPVGEAPEDAVEPGQERHRLQHLLLLGGGDVDQPGDEVGELAGVVDRLHGRGEGGRGLFEQADGLERALLELVEAGVDLGAALGRLLDALDADGGMVGARRPLGDAGAAPALQDDVVAALAVGDVAQQPGFGADRVEVGERGLLDGGVALEDGEDRAALLRGGLQAGDGGRRGRRRPA